MARGRALLRRPKAPEPKPVPEPSTSDPMPWGLHKFKRPSDGHWSSNCQHCYGWYDDPRHI